MSGNKQKRKRDELSNAPNKKRKLWNAVNAPDIQSKLSSGQYKTKNKSGIKTKSKTWDHVLVVYDPSPYKDICTKCKYCNKTYSINTSSSSWNLHLTAHKEKVKKAELAFSQKNGKQLKIKQFTKTVNFNKDDKTFMKKASLSFVVKDLRAFYAVKGDGFDDVVTAAYNLGVKKAILCDSLRKSGVLSDDTTISREVEVEYDIEKGKVKGEFAEVLNIFPAPISFTTDNSEYKRKKTGQKIIGVTAHYTLRNNPNLKCVYLSCDNFKEKIDEMKSDQNYIEIESNEDDAESDVEEWVDIQYSSEDEEDVTDIDVKDEENNDYSANYANTRKLIKYILTQFGLDKLFGNEYSHLFNEDEELNRVYNGLKSTVSTDSHSANKK